MRASELELRNVEVLEERDFLNENHLQGYVPSKVCYGLYSGDSLIELMSFGEPRYNRNYSWELLRLCTKKDCQVYGGASKLFKHFLDETDIGFGVLSYCNRDFFSGKVYRELGFVSNGLVKGYHYEKDGKKYHRSNFTKARCIKLWPELSHLSERKIMELKGYARVEDSIGQELFIYGDKAKMYIYKLTFEDGATYIGQHIQYKEFDDYVTSSKYAENHKIANREIILYCNDRATLDLMESLAIADDKYYSKKNVNGNLGNFVFKIYNIGCQRNYSWSEETRRKFRESMLGHITSEETKRKISESNKGRKRTEEQRARIAESHKGIKHSDESKKKVSEALKRLTAEGKHKVFTEGHIMSVETRKKISETMKGRKPKTTVKGLKWFNNGIKSVRAKECPEGFTPGRI